LKISRQGAIDPERVFNRDRNRTQIFFSRIHLIRIRFPNAIIRAIFFLKTSTEKSLPENRDQ
jgi:hypothetical protein